MTNLLWLLVSVLVQVESGGRPVVGDHGKAVGVLQMRPVAVLEARRVTGWQGWRMEDRWHPVKARLMCWHTLAWHYRRGVRDPVELAARWRNPFGKDAPDWYKRKIRRELARRGVGRVEVARNE